MKRTVPLLITAVVGFVLVCSAFVPAAESWGEKALIWFDLLAGIAFILGGANLVGAQLRKISTRRKGWGYALVTLVAFLATLGVGILKIGVRPAPNQEFHGETFVPVALNLLPEMTYEVAVPADVRAKPLPPSVRHQVMLTDRGLKITGWLNGSQLSDLADADPTLAWQCAVEKLGALVKPPKGVDGRLLYRPEHRALAYRGVMTSEDQAALKSELASSPGLLPLIDELSNASNRSVKVATGPPPEGFELPAALASRLSLDAGQLTWRGPMSAAEREQLSIGTLRSRIAYPLGEAGRASFEKVIAGDGTLNDEQTKTLDRIVTANWSDDLIAALNTAGVAKPGRKTVCELVAERERGVTDLDPVIPAGSSVELTSAQKDAIASFVAGPVHDWAALEGTLRAAGPWTDAQASALSDFREALPTVGQRNRKLFDELVKAGPLTTAQRTALLKEYQGEFMWAATIGKVFAASNAVKYPWSGEFNQQGSPFWWLFEYIFQPIQSMMFALLAFYVASSAFRAFRAKNLEATLLLATAFIILLGRTYIGSLATAWLPQESPLRLENLSVDIMRVFNAAGNRAIMIGIALGIASTSLKILLGIDRSHTGGKD